MDMYAVEDQRFRKRKSDKDYKHYVGSKKKKYEIILIKGMK